MRTVNLESLILLRRTPKQRIPRPIGRALSEDEIYEMLESLDKDITVSPLNFNTDQPLAIDTKLNEYFVFRENALYDDQ